MLLVKGVIYAIIHLPSNRIYVGQTVNTAYHRFKHHWYSRHSSEFHGRMLHKSMSQQVLSNYIVWPLEKIDQESYTDNSTFRRIASERETFWIKRLRTLQPRGFNCYLPCQNSRQRRKSQPQRWEERDTNNPPPSTFSPYTIENNLLRINTNPGPAVHLRRTLSSWIKLAHDKSTSLEHTIAQCGYSYRRSILRWVAANIPTKDYDDHIGKIESIIRGLSHKKGHFPRVNKEKEDHAKDFIKVVHAHELITFANIRGVLRDKEIHKLLMTEEIPSICDKQVNPISRYLCNFTNVSTALPDNNIDLDSNTCACRQLLRDHTDKDLVDGHIATCNYDLISNPSVRSLFKYGSKFRRNLSIAAISESLQLGLEEYINKRIRREQKANNLPYTMQVLEDKLSQWKTAVLKQCEANLKTCRDFKHKQKSQLNDSLYVCLLKHNFTILNVDKVSHNMGIMCKKLYQHKLMSELQSPVYQQSTESYDEVMSRHKDFNTTHSLDHVDNFPYLYGALKMHKVPPGLRYIAGVRTNRTEQDTDTQPSTVARIHSRPHHKPKCSTTAASASLSKKLQVVMKILRIKDQKLFESKGYRRCWFVRSAEEVFHDIKMNMDILRTRKPKTFDFTRMYTNLSHEKIINNVKSAIQEAIDYETHIQATSAMVQSQLLAQIGQLGDIMELVSFIVKNTYFSNDNTSLIHQSAGIPMGTNAAPELANLCLYTDESRWVDSLIRSGDISTARLHAHTSRFIDDILSWDTDPPPSDIYGLEYVEQTRPDGSVVFLGALISPCPDGTLRMSVFDKTTEWNFPVIKYPHRASNSPYHQSAGVFQGQLSRFRSICNSIKDFKVAVTTLTVKMLHRDHHPKDLFKGWNGHLIKFSKDKKTNYSAFRKWFRRMLYWSIRHHNDSNVMSLIYKSTSTVPPVQPVDSVITDTQSTNGPSSPSTSLSDTTSSPSPPADKDEVLDTENLILLTIEDPRCAHLQDTMQTVLRNIDRRKNTARQKPLRRCSDCMLYFHSLHNHKNKRNITTCTDAATLRTTLIELLERPPLEPPPVSPRCPPQVAITRADAQELLASRQLRLVEDTPADGDCFFHAAISTSAEILKNYTSITLRAELCDYLESHPDTVIYEDAHGSSLLESVFSVNDSTADSYSARVQQLRRPYGEYADSLIIYALVSKFNLTLDILDLETNSWQLYTPFQQHHTQEVLNLVREHNPICHYMGTAPICP